jgi:GNAT superfamily N-acetyltransferase
MISIPHENLRVIPLTKESSLSAFHSNNNELNDFLKNDALTSQDFLISRTYLCYYGETLVGFLTLVTDTIEVKLVDVLDGVNGYQYSKYPCIKIARIAVDRDYAGKGIGRFLLLWAVGTVYRVSRVVGCRYITVDAKRESVPFYEKNGFRLIKRYAVRNFPPMYLNMYPIIININNKKSVDQP